jgi:hypothetical protein
MCSLKNSFVINIFNYMLFLWNIMNDCGQMVLRVTKPRLFGFVGHPKQPWFDYESILILYWMILVCYISFYSGRIKTGCTFRGFRGRWSRIWHSFGTQVRDSNPKSRKVCKIFIMLKEAFFGVFRFTDHEFDIRIASRLEFRYF